MTGKTREWLRSRTVVAAMLVGLWSPVSVWQVQEVRDFQLSLIRQYGRFHFSQCRLHVGTYGGNGTASLVCDYAGVDGKGRPIAPLMAREELIPAETKQLADLVNRSALYDGNHVGSDSTSGDGIFETLKFQGDRGTVVLVTSGNPSFAQNADRKELLSLLTTIEKRLTDRGKPK